jgi:uncharacterized membrane protein
MRQQDEYHFLDILRGLCISSVVLYHFMFDLKYFRLINSFPSSLGEDSTRLMEYMKLIGYCFLNFFILQKLLNSRSKTRQLFGCSLFLASTWLSLLNWWHETQKLGVAMLMFIMGYSASLKHQKFIDYRWLMKRILKLSGLAGIISLVSYFVDSQKYIYFGALHCIAFLSLVQIPFLYIKDLTGILGLSILLSDFSVEFPKYQPTLDFMPWYKNLGFLLLGIYSQHKNVKFTRINGFEGFAWMGKNSLQIYLIHQVVLFPVLWGITSLLE